MAFNNNFLAWSMQEDLLSIPGWEHNCWRRGGIEDRDQVYMQIVHLIYVQNGIRIEITSPI